MEPGALSAIGALGAPGALGALGTLFALGRVKLCGLLQTPADPCGPVLRVESC